MTSADQIKDLLQKNNLLCFDFDGTLVDSNPIKLKAFDLLFEKEAAHFSDIQAYTHANHHTPRWEKFKFVYEKILKRAYTPEIEKKLLREYESLTTQAIIRAPEIPGARQFLQNLKDKTVGLLSSSPHDILRSILEGRKWDFFDEVRGAPVQKADWLSQWAQINQTPPNRAVYFGDSFQDRDAALQAGWIFIGVRNAKLKEGDAPFVNDFDILKTP